MARTDLHRFASPSRRNQRVSLVNSLSQNHQRRVNGMIQVNELRKSYGSTVAVDGVSFEVRSGETFGLLGPNGAGKTTTINMMIGVLEPDGGSIAVNGCAKPTEPAARRTIGVAPQALAIYEELSALENLTFFGRLYNLTGARLKERVAWALEFAGLEDRGRSRAKTYSGGMKRRLNMAVSLVHDPQVVFSMSRPWASIRSRATTFSSASNN